MGKVSAAQTVLQCEPVLTRARFYEKRRTNSDQFLEQTEGITRFYTRNVLSTKRGVQARISTSA